MANKQLPLFPTSHSKSPSHDLERMPPTLETTFPLSPTSSLTSAITAYHEQMRRQGLSPYTIQAFGGDLRLFRRFVGSNIAIGDVSTDTIDRFLKWLKYERGIPCKPKSFQRRLTTLKVFFSWLTQSKVLVEDPAAPIAHQPVTSPLPEILYPEQVAKLVEAAIQVGKAKNDIRPYLLVSLLLSTGIKKSEAMAIRLADIDVSEARKPVLFIRYDDARKRHKERKLRVPPDFADSFRLFREQYGPRERLFECTARNLEYVLAELAHTAGLEDTVSFESLRWTCAVQDYERGMNEDHLRQKLGLSTITWEEASERLRRLAGKPL